MDAEVPKDERRLCSFPPLLVRPVNWDATKLVVV
jgi:hypothetical protein